MQVDIAATATAAVPAQEVAQAQERARKRIPEDCLV